MHQAKLTTERLSERRSRSEQVLATGDAYEAVKTPIADGALRNGGAADIYSLRNIGLLAQNAGYGLIYGSIVGVAYPFLNNFLRLSGTESSSALALIVLPWSFKMFFGVVTDCYPVFGYRRRPYIILGWLICFVACLLMAVLPVGAPFYQDPALALIPLEELTPEQLALVNPSASRNGFKYIALMVLGSLGSVIAATASDGVLVELAQREPESVRGRIQATVFMAQDSFSLLATALIGFGMNSEAYGGEWDFAIGFNALMGLSALFSLAMLPLSWFCMTEERVRHEDCQSVRVYFAMLYDLVQQRVVYQIVAFRFFRNLLSWITPTASYPIQSLWAGVKPFNSSVASILGFAMAILASYLTKKCGLGWSWRSMIVLTQVAVVVLDAVPTYFTIWDVVRNQWFWLGGPLLQNLPNYMGYLISTFCVVEIIDVGSEAAVYGLLTTVSDLASPFSTVLSKNIDAHFDVDFAFLQQDDAHVRTQVSYNFAVAYALKLLSLAFIGLLPRQKREMQELRRSGGKSKWMGILTITYLAFAFCWSLMTNLMSFSSSTACLVIAGGDGCSSEQDA